MSRTPNKKNEDAQNGDTPTPAKSTKKKKSDTEDGADKEKDKEKKSEKKRKKSDNEGEPNSEKKSKRKKNTDEPMLTKKKKSEPLDDGDNDKDVISFAKSKISKAKQMNPFLKVQCKSAHQILIICRIHLMMSLMSLILRTSRVRRKTRTTGLPRNCNLTRRKAKQTTA